MKARFILFFIVLIQLLTSCSYKQLQFQGIENIKFDQVNKQGIKTTIYARIENPNRYKIHLRSKDLQLKLAGTHFGKAVMPKKITIKPNVLDTYALQLEVGYKDLAKSALKSLPSMLLKQSVFAEIKGEVRGRVFLFSKKYPLNLNKKIKLVGSEQ